MGTVRLIDRDPRIKKSSIDRVRSEADFVQVVGSRTPLRRMGTRFVGRCPFHGQGQRGAEENASFAVNAADKLYYCFECHKGGDMIGFVRETQGVNFVQAVEWLAQRFGIPLSYE